MPSSELNQPGAGGGGAVRPIELGPRMSAAALAAETGGAVEAALPALVAARTPLPAQAVAVDGGGELKTCVDRFTSVTGTSFVVRLLYAKGGRRWVKRVCEAKPALAVEWCEAVPT